MNVIIDDNGKVRKMEHIELAEKIIKLRKNKDIWVVIDELVKIWAKISPDDEAAIRVNVQMYKETQTDKKHAQTLGGKDFERRMMIAFPQTLMLLIRTQYKADELPFDREFYRLFAKRYPAFQIPDKL